MKITISTFRKDSSFIPKNGYIYWSLDILPRIEWHYDKHLYEECTNIFECSWLLWGIIIKIITGEIKPSNFQIDLNSK